MNPKITESPPLDYNRDIVPKIESELNKRLIQIGAYIISAIAILILGAIIGTVWQINADVSFLKGIISSPKEVIEYQDNKIMQLQNEINYLKSKNANLNGGNQP